ncbi:hypothetical protein BX661DRAFT_179599 [Kickxella alabastrina]|uniref:uncharacterized protein n=1 Tax=Kickxella alabastrina TaxID=61397 RepID=UPI00221FD05A|nr:uncharacterized protein BX661DRAFT_179599 [Kickxella alabastrina]KAI7831979.1 hypothetical protein BX661DRAFT_179599 [Kickxella alabastrina]
MHLLLHLVKRQCINSALTPFARDRKLSTRPCPSAKPRRQPSAAATHPHRQRADLFIHISWRL